MKKDLVLGVGEILIRFTTTNYGLLRNSTNYWTCFGGGEFNVIASLANWGIKTKMFSAISNNEFGESILKYVNSFNIDSSLIRKTNHRTGLYFLEEGFSQRPSKIIYDRNDSAFSNINIDEYDLKKVFQDVTWIHISGITPALNENTLKLTKEIINYAKKNKIKICFDINWRSSLWELEKATEILSELVEGIDILIGISPLKLNLESNDLIIAKKDSYDYYLSLCRQIKSIYKVKNIAFSYRDSLKMNNNNLKCYYYNSGEDKLYESSLVNVDVLDRIGTGDALTAGVLYGVINNLKSQDILDIAEASFVLKHTVKDDVNTLTINEIKSYCKNKNKPIRIVR